MLEILLGICLFGLFIAHKKNLGPANPFSIYFSVWLLIITLFYLLQSTFDEASGEFIFILIIMKTIALILLFTVKPPAHKLTPEDGYKTGRLVRSKLLLLAQIIVIAFIPAAYSRAIALSGGFNIFSIGGYISLRASMTDGGQNFGYISYLAFLSYVITSLSVYLMRFSIAGIFRASISIAVSLFYVYIGTGRTLGLFLITSIIVPLIILRSIRTRWLIITAGLIAALFIFIALMTAKGISSEATIAENFISFTENLQSYTVAPLLALNKLIQSAPKIEFGNNMFRIIFAISNFIGLSDHPPVPLIRNFVFVPNPTNVYTVYDVYFRDFWYFGMIFPPLFLLGHWWIYRRAQVQGGRWIFIYASTVYALIMQFFQDQYFSLASSWIQLIAWYMLFVKSSTLITKNRLD